jgi:hypothetical protein
MPMPLLTRAALGLVATLANAPALARADLQSLPIADVLDNPTCASRLPGVTLKGTVVKLK